MAVLTLEILLLFLTVSFFLYRGNLIGPWFLVCLAILVSYVIVLLNYGKWDVSISPRFTLCIAIACAAWGAGAIILRCLVGEPLHYSKAESGMVQSARMDNLALVRYPYHVFALLSALLTIIYVLQIIEIDSIQSVASLQVTLRGVYEDGSGEGFFGVQAREVVFALGYISVHRMLILRFDDKKQLKARALSLAIPIVMLLICVLVVTDRNIFLRLMIYTIFLYVMFAQSQSAASGALFKLILKVACIGAVVFLLFYLYGLSKQYTSSLFDSLSIYGGSGLNNFNIWLSDFEGPLTDGDNTFSSLQHTLATLGIGDGSDLPWNKDPNVLITPSGFLYDSNVYSAFKDYFSDFGYMGLLLIPFFIGVFLELLYVLASRNRYGITWVLYAFFLYVPIYTPIMEFFLKRLHFYFAYEIFWLVLLYFAAYGIARAKKPGSFYVAEKSP